MGRRKPMPPPPPPIPALEELGPSWTSSPILFYIGVGAAAFLSLWMLLFAVAMYLQECKSIKRVNPLRFFPFVYIWMIGSLFFSLLCFPEALIFPSKLREHAHYFSGLLAVAMYRLTVGPSSISGLENLLPPDAAAVYVANHNSMVDIALFYKIGMGRRFAWVSKSTVFLVPGVGLIMRLSKYVALTRGSRDSIKQMFDACKKSLSVGWPVAIFPQGTRRRHKFLDFKDGAFKLAIESGVPLVPVSIYIPEDVWHGSKEPARVIVHKPIKPGDAAFADVAALKAAAFTAIVGDLPYVPNMLTAQVAEAAKAMDAGAVAGVVAAVTGGNGGKGAAPAESKKIK